MLSCVSLSIVLALVSVLVLVGVLVIVGVFVLVGVLVPAGAPTQTMREVVRVLRFGGCIS